jgi:hypothetical protein
MIVTITKQRDHDRILIDRPDRPPVETRFPKKGSVPHDAVHFIVERALGLRRGFWGLIAYGRDPEAIQTLAKEAGHASASRATPPAPHIVELLQAERLVECFEAALWDGGADPATLRDIARVACESSFVALPPLDDATILAIMVQVRELHAGWANAPVGHAIRYDWHLA